MGSLLGEAQVEEGPRGESGPAQDAGCLGERPQPKQVFGVSELGGFLRVVALGLTA